MVWGFLAPLLELLDLSLRVFNLLLEWACFRYIAGVLNPPTI
jgi:hypothetical protein